MTAREEFLASRGFIERSHPSQPTDIRPLAITAAERLKSAIVKGQTTSEGTTAYYLAQAHALMGHSPESIATWLRRAVSGKEFWSFAEGEALSLLSTCSATLQVLEVLDAYQQKPMTLEDIRALLNPQFYDRLEVETRNFITFTNSSVPVQYPPSRPGRVTFRSHDRWNTCYVEWLAAEEGIGHPRRGGIPQFPSTRPIAYRLFLNSGRWMTF